MTSRQKLIGLGLGFLLALVGGFEGQRLLTYRDVVQVPTVCFGHTETAQIGQKKTPAECQELLASDLLAANDGVNSCVHVPLNTNQRAAFVSLTFNVGRGAFCKSTIVRRLNAGDYVGACNELPRWVYAGKKILPGLVKRRAAERDLCLLPVAA